MFIPTSVILPSFVKRQKHLPQGTPWRWMSMLTSKEIFEHKYYKLHLTSRQPSLNYIHRQVASLPLRRLCRRSSWQGLQGTSWRRRSTPLSAQHPCLPHHHSKFSKICASSQKTSNKVINRGADQVNHTLFYFQ
jgi:hypothetical protein